MLGEACARGGGRERPGRGGSWAAQGALQWGGEAGGSGPERAWAPPFCFSPIRLPYPLVNSCSPYSYGNRAATQGLARLQRTINRLSGESE